MSTTSWNEAPIERSSVRTIAIDLTRQAAFWGGTAIMAVALNAGAVLALLYWASILE